MIKKIDISFDVIGCRKDKDNNYIGLVTNSDYF